MRKGILTLWLILTVGALVSMFTSLNILARCLTVALCVLNIYTVIANFKLAHELDKINGTDQNGMSV